MNSIVSLPESLTQGLLIGQLLKYYVRSYRRRVYSSRTCVFVVTVAIIIIIITTTIIIIIIIIIVIIIVELYYAVLCCSIPFGYGLYVMECNVT